MYKHSTSISKWNLEVLAFLKGEILENPEKNPWSREKTNNKLNPLYQPYYVCMGAHVFSCNMKQKQCFISFQES